MAGHRMLSAMTLVVASVIPVTFGSVLIWTMLGWSVDAYGYGLIFLAGIIATAMPYAVGWLRGLVSLLATTVLLRVVAVWLDDVALIWTILASLALLAGIGGLTSWSLRFGTVRRPRDAKEWRTTQGSTWPYPYA